MSLIRASKLSSMSMRACCPIGRNPRRQPINITLNILTCHTRAIQLVCGFHTSQIRNNPSDRFVTQSHSSGHRTVYNLHDVQPDSYNKTAPVVLTKDTAMKRAASSYWDVRKLVNRIVNQLLPFGYPVSVQSGYVRFAVFQFIASTLGTICGVISMQSLFHAVGIGSSLSSMISPC